jgi:uncharacterized protein YggL (DUF469 family)
MMQRRVGPTPLREVAFIVALLSEAKEPFDACFNRLIAFAQETNGVTLSGGRYRRTPENIFMTPATLANESDGG